MQEPPGEDKAYRVLARKYRPTRFDDLIGQEALVRTLSNAIATGRLAQAFILTGVRGVGKTTTARIIARALNCTGPDGDGGPTISPCGVCEHCRAIAQDRHVDVIEMDAASRTGVDDMRELIEGVRYRPMQARRKVYIIDEVHMLSKSAFNALLKTLEEPPEHVVFVFATTEIRKVPVTVLSRCQRFDLRRVSQEALADHFAGICAKEGIEAEAEALALVARAADGSVRDGLSLLDQAIALAAGALVTAQQVHGMLGLADRTRIFDLYDALMAGKAAEALGLLRQLYDAGADPQSVIQDLLELTHLLTRAKLVPESLSGEPEAERERGGAMAKALSLPVLARGWQILLKGLEEMRAAPFALQAAEMVLIRLTHASSLPPPGELVRALKFGEAPAAPSAVPPPAAAPPGDAPGPAAKAANPDEPPAAPLVEAPPAADRAADTKAAGPPALHDLRDLVALAREWREMSLANHLMKDLHLVRLEPGRLEFRQREGAPAKLAAQIGQFLQEATGERWMVSVSREAGERTLAEQDDTLEREKRAVAMQHPLVQAALETFPGAQMVDRRDKPGAGLKQAPAGADEQDGDTQAVAPTAAAVREGDERA